MLTIVYQQPHTYAWTKWSFKLCVCVCGESGKNFVRVKCILDAQECLMCCCNNCICIEKSVEEVKVPTLYIFSTHCYTFFHEIFYLHLKQLWNNSQTTFRTFCVKMVKMKKVVLRSSDCHGKRENRELFHYQLMHLTRQREEISVKYIIRNPKCWKKSS